ncbi:MAG: hypothetical protein ACE5F9_07000 [Phycisphaerae bacterium]
MKDIARRSPWIPRLLCWTLAGVGLALIVHATRPRTREPRPLPKTASLLKVRPLAAAALRANRPTLEPETLVLLALGPISGDLIRRQRDRRQAGY